MTHANCKRCLLTNENKAAMVKRRRRRRGGGELVPLLRSIHCLAKFIMRNDFRLPSSWAIFSASTWMLLSLALFLAWSSSCWLRKKPQTAYLDHVGLIERLPQENKCKRCDFQSNQAAEESLWKFSSECSFRPVYSLVFWEMAGISNVVNLKRCKPTLNHLSRIDMTIVDAIQLDAYAIIGHFWLNSSDESVLNQQIVHTA